MLNGWLVQGESGRVEWVWVEMWWDGEGGVWRFCVVPSYTLLWGQGERGVAVGSGVHSVRVLSSRAGCR